LKYGNGYSRVRYGNSRVETREGESKIEKALIIIRPYCDRTANAVTSPKAHWSRRKKTGQREDEEQSGDTLDFQELHEVCLVLDRAGFGAAQVSPRASPRPNFQEGWAFSLQ